MKVNLQDVIEAIEFENDQLSHYYNKETGVIIYKEDESSSRYKAEDFNRLEEFEEWERELIKELKDLEDNPNNYIKLPDYKDVDEYKLMVSFSKVNNIDIKASVKELKEEIEKRALLSEWYTYREEAEKNIAVSWCNENHINIL